MQAIRQRGFLCNVGIEIQQRQTGIVTVGVFGEVQQRIVVCKQKIDKEGAAQLRPCCSFANEELGALLA